MPIGGFEGLSGRRVRNVERALSASTLLPTLAFAALGTVIVLLVAQMGIAPLGAVVGPSAHDGGRAVTTPRMSISIGPPRLPRSTPARDRETTTGGPTGPTTLTIARQVAHTIAPTRGRETTTDDAQSAAMTAAVTNADVTTWEVTTRPVTTAPVRPHARADTEMMVVSKVMYTLVTRAAMAPTPEPEDQKSPKSPKAPNEDTSVTSVKTAQTAQSTPSTDTAYGSEHAKAAEIGS